MSWCCTKKEGCFKEIFRAVVCRLLVQDYWYKNVWMLWGRAVTFTDWTVLVRSASLKVTTWSAVFMTTTTTCLSGVTNATLSKLSVPATLLRILREPRGMYLLHVDQQQ